MKLELVKNPSIGSFDVPTAIGVELVSSGVVQLISRDYNGSWYAWMRRGTSGLNHREKKSLGSVIDATKFPPGPFLKKLEDAITFKLGCVFNHTIVWTSETETDVLLSPSTPRACRLSEIPSTPEAADDVVSALPPTFKYATGLLRIKQESVEKVTFDLEGALINFFSSAFANAILDETLPDTKWTHESIKRPGVIRLCHEFAVHRLDERFKDFGEVAFVAFGKMGVTKPVLQ